MTNSSESAHKRRRGSATSASQIQSLQPITGRYFEELRSKQCSARRLSQNKVITATAACTPCSMLIAQCSTKGVMYWPAETLPATKQLAFCRSRDSHSHRCCSTTAQLSAPLAVSAVAPAFAWEYQWRRLSLILQSRPDLHARDACWDKQHQAPEMDMLRGSLFSASALGWCSGCPSPARPAYACWGPTPKIWPS